MAQSSADSIDFKSGDEVVYPSHGVGRITGEETQTVAGYEVQVYVVEFCKDRMTLRVPKKRAKTSGLRALSSASRLKKSLIILKEKARPGRGMWSRRAQEYEAKINSGDIIAVSEVVRDLYKNVDDPDRSYSERVIYESALDRLAGEYAAVKGVTAEEAESQLISVLKSRKVKAGRKTAGKDQLDDSDEFEAA